jgi:hypothetical protein
MNCSDCGEEYLKRNIAVNICPKCNGKLISSEFNEDGEI